jgi:hypothetical protein
MPDHSTETAGPLYYCESCGQLFRTYADWSNHANGPYPTVSAAMDYLREIDPGEKVPAGARVGESMCHHGVDADNASAFTDIKQGDIVVRADGGAFVGRVGHADDQKVSVELPEGGIVTKPREEFTAPGGLSNIRR